MKNSLKLKAIVTMLVFGIILSGTTVPAQAKTKTKSYTVGGITFKVPKAYRLVSDYSTKDHKVFVPKNKEDDYLDTIEIYASDDIMGVNKMSISDFEDWENLLNTDNSSSFKVSKLKRSKVGKYNAVLYSCDRKGGFITKAQQKIFTIDNTDRNITVTVDGRYYKLDDVSINGAPPIGRKLIRDVSVIAKSAKVAKKKK